MIRQSTRQVRALSNIAVVAPALTQRTMSIGHARPASPTVRWRTDRERSILDNASSDEPVNPTSRCRPYTSFAACCAERNIDNHLIERLPREDRRRLLAQCVSVDLVLSQVLATSR